MIVPMYTAADKAWYFKSWDKFMLPKPFADVTLRFGKMIRFPEDTEARLFEGQRAELEKIMPRPYRPFGWSGVGWIQRFLSPS